MQYFRNLRLAVRLAIAFGAVAVGLLLVGSVAVTAMGGLKDKTDALGSHDLRATTLAGDLAERNTTIRALVAEHLYVRDGDLDAQDKLQQRLESLADQNTKAGDELERLLEGTDDEAEMTAFATTRATFRERWQEAVERSRHETVDGDEERDGSRGLFVDEVAPTGDKLAADAAKLQADIEDSAQATMDEAHAAASSGTRTIVIVAVLALLAAAALATVVTRSVVRPVAALGDRLRSLNDHCLAGLQTGLGLVRDGNLTYQVEPVTTPVEVESTDELGRLSETFNGMLDKAQISIEAYNDMRGQLGSLIGEVAGSADTVASASQEMASTSDEAGRAVGEIANAVGDVAQGAERQVRMVEAARQSAQEAAGAASTSAERAQETASAAAEAREVAREGVNAAEQSSASAEQVSASTQQTSASTQEIAASAQELARTAESLQELVGRFTLTA